MKWQKYLSAGPLLIFVAAVLWGLDGVWRRSLYVLDPMIIVFYEHLIGVLIILPWLWGKDVFKGWDRKSGGALLVVSILSGILGTFWFTTALGMVNFIPFSVVLLLQKLQPLFAIATAAFILKEKISWDYVKWGALAIGAAYFITFPEGTVSFANNPQSVTAALYALGAAAAWGTSTAFSRYALLKKDYTVVTGLRFAIVAGLLFVWIQSQGQTELFSVPSPEQMWTLVLIALSTGMVALWLYYKGLQKTKASHSTIVELAFPLTAVLIEPYLYKTSLEPIQYVAGTVLLAAIWKVSQLHSRRQKVADATTEKKTIVAKNVTEDIEVKDEKKVTKKKVVSTKKRKTMATRSTKKKRSSKVAPKSTR